MFLLDYSNFTAPAANDTPVSDHALIMQAIDNVIVSGDVDFAEQSMFDCDWSLQQAAEYVASKARGFIPLDKQSVLQQTLIDMLKLTINC